MSTRTFYHALSRAARNRRVLGAALLGAILLGGCIAGPSPSATAADAGSIRQAEPADGTRTGTGSPTLPPCPRVWSEAQADSVWDCPDPRPPSPVRSVPR